MLSYISHKFSQEIPTHVNEPRAALFLNRFSRTLAIMYATNGLADVIGVPADQLIGKSFYFCIQENCLREAVKCLESAKANDSIAYLRFWFRDPTQDARQNSTRQGEDDLMTDGNSSGDDDDGGVHLAELMEHDGNENAILSDSSNSIRSSAEPRNAKLLDPNSRSTSDNSTDRDGSIQDFIFDQPAGGQSRTSSISTPDDGLSSSQSWSPEHLQIELEAVVSCTSDGLVVVLRRAKPFVPRTAAAAAETTKHEHANGFFASPWATEPILPTLQSRANPMSDSIRPPQFPIHPSAAQANTAATTGPVTEDFMNSIREVAVFAWSLTGINGSLEKYGRGTPSGESLPPEGYPIWDPSSTAGAERQTSNAYISNGYNYSPSDGTPIDRQIEVKNGMADGYHHKATNHDGPYAPPAPSHNTFYEHPQCNDYGQKVSGHHAMKETNGYGHSPFHNGYGGQEDFGGVNQSQSMDIDQRNHRDQRNQSNGYHDGIKTEEYDPYAPNMYHESNPSYDEVQNGAFQNHNNNNRITITEFDPYAPTTYQPPPSASVLASAHNPMFPDPHPGTRRDTTHIPQSQPQSNGHSY